MSNLKPVKEGSLPVSAEPPEQKPLTPRQHEIMQLIVSGLTYRQVADQLCISETTIKFHMNEIRKRLHLKNRTHAIACFLTSSQASRA